MGAIKRVAVIGAGPAGAITIDALAREKTFDVIRVFERREAAGGCWVGDQTPPPHLTALSALASRTADRPIPVPETLPTRTPKHPAPAPPRFTESGIYPYLETNVDAIPMSFSEESIPELRTENSVALHGPDTPFRHWTVVRDFVQGLVNRNGYQDFVSYNTTVERAEKVGHEWKLTLRREDDEGDEWWVEWFDAVVVATGHYWVPYVPDIEGLDDFEKARPGSVIHSKYFRGREKFRDKRVVVVGASVSGADISVDLVKTAKLPVYSVVNGRKANLYFGDGAFNHPRLSRRATIARIHGRTVHFSDGTSVADVDNIVFATGFTWTLPFLPSVEVRNNRVPGLYQHVVYHRDPTLLFIGAVAAGLTFKIFEWQAVLAARVLAGRARLPSADEQARWEADRVAEKGDDIRFSLVHPHFEEYFETVRALAGEPENGVGRPLPAYDPSWLQIFLDGLELRKKMFSFTDTSMDILPPPPPPKPPSGFGLGRCIKALRVNIKGILRGPSLTPNFLVSDMVGFLLHLALAADWPAVWRRKLFRSVPLSRALADNLYDFWVAFRKERWHKEDHAEARMDKWCPHLYRSPPPRLRSYREILNRQQALKNCCGAQLHGLETRDVARNMLLQAGLAFCWAWALLSDHITLIRLLAAIENDRKVYRDQIEASTPPVFRKGEDPMPVARGGQSHSSLRRVQRQISRGHDLIDKFVELEMCDVGNDAAWVETEWLSETDGVIPADMVVDADRFLVNRVVFSA
ncbi:Thiol-specific monooxygenase, partial [Colletotrichum shisoi]